MTQGVIYYNTGTGCLARLAVSLHTLRKYYNGGVTIISDGDDSNKACQMFEADTRLRVNVVTPLVNVREGRNHHYLAKCRLHEMTPYDVSLFIDSDTIVTGDLTPLLPMAVQNEFVTTEFCNWKSSGRQISRRILQWRDIRPKDMKPALAFGPALNTGVMAFTRDSKFMADWFKIARRGRHLRIPDEVSCQVVLHRYPHKVADHNYNASCRYDDCDSPSVRLIHYHGRKHCREGLPFNGEKWIAAYEAARKLNIAGIADWAPSGDRQLSRYLRGIDRKNRR